LHFENLIFEPVTYLSTILKEDHPGIIPVKFGKNPIRGFRGDVV